MGKQTFKILAIGNGKFIIYNNHKKFEEESNKNKITDEFLKLCLETMKLFKEGE